MYHEVGLFYEDDVANILVYKTFKEISKTTTLQLKNFNSNTIRD